MKSISLSDRVRDVLARSTISHDRVILPEQLDRALYLEVAKVLKAAGGKWNRSENATLFPRDPREALGLALDTGKIQNEQQVRQSFYTPDGIAEYVINTANITAGMTVLEPSAGNGSLAILARCVGGDVTAIEIDPIAVRELLAAFEWALHGYDVIQDDFLTSSEIEPCSFDRVIMNPPFANGQEVKHIQLAYEYLKPGGKLVSIMSNGVTFRTDKLYAAFRNWLSELNADIRPLASKSFQTSGTGVETVLVVIDKPEVLPS